MPSVVPYEIDFHPVGNGAKSGDAITMRYWDGGRWHVVVIDGGYRETGDMIRDHILSVYGTNQVDHVVCTHPDGDHAGGLSVILSDLQVGSLWTHVPFFHAFDVMPLFESNRWHLDNLRNEIRRAYPIIEELLCIAETRGVNVFSAFQGNTIGPLTVLSPTLPMYTGLMPQFRNLPAHDRNTLAALGILIPGVGKRPPGPILNSVPENWWTETLRDGGQTSAENESSVVLYANFGDGGILLTADAGPIALQTAITYATGLGVPFGESLRLFQVPHHGSRNNIGPQILNQLIGFPFLEQGAARAVSCVISAGPEDPAHPRRVVVNALIRRGLRPRATRFGPIRCAGGLPGRPGWGEPVSLPFQPYVEEYV